VEGTRSIYLIIITCTPDFEAENTHMVVYRRTLGGKSAPEEGP